MLHMVCPGDEDEGTEAAHGVSPMTMANTKSQKGQQHKHI